MKENKFSFFFSLANIPRAIIHLGLSVFSAARLKAPISQTSYIYIYILYLSSNTFLSGCRLISLAFACTLAIPQSHRPIASNTLKSLAGNPRVSLHTTQTHYRMHRFCIEESFANSISLIYTVICLLGLGFLSLFTLFLACICVCVCRTHNVKLILQRRNN